MLIKNLPDDIKSLAIKNRLNLGRAGHEWLCSAFPWGETTEGFKFWKLCDAGLFDKARLLCDQIKDKTTQQQFANNPP